MQQIGIKALKNGLSGHLRAVQAGETLQVTDRGRVVAELVPPRVTGPRSDEEILADHERRGLVRRATVPKGTPLPEGFLKVSLEQLLRDLDEDRADR